MRPHRARTRRVAAHSIRSRILKGRNTISATSSTLRRSPFDPFEDTESHCPMAEAAAKACRSPFDPFEDTESSLNCAGRNYSSPVAAHSIRSRILKGIADFTSNLIVAGRSPFDPFEDTESCAVILGQEEQGVSQPIRSVRGY